MSPASRIADAAIRAYQRRISPHKGWSCAVRVATGGPSCSAVVREIVRSRGVLRGVVPTVAQFLSCYRAASVMIPAQVQGGGVCCCGPIPIPFRFGPRRGRSGAGT